VSADTITSEHWQWRDGGWQPVPSANNVQQWRMDDNGQLTITPATNRPIPDSLYLDALPGYEREPGDNRLRGTPEQHQD